MCVCAHVRICAQGGLSSFFCVRMYHCRAGWDSKVRDWRLCGNVFIYPYVSFVYVAGDLVCLRFTNNIVECICRVYGFPRHFAHCWGERVFIVFLSHPPYLLFCLVCVLYAAQATVWNFRIVHTEGGRFVFPIHTFAKFIYPQSNIKSLLIFENPHIHSERVNHGRQQEGTGTRWTA